MKTSIKNLFFLLPLMAGLALIPAGRLTAQTFTVLHSFTGSDGANPYAGLILSGNTLYGTAYQGGSSGNGVVFKVNTNGTGFTNLYSFTATPGPFYTNSDGAYPYAELILSGNTLYGTAYVGGGSGAGTVFKVNTDGTGFTILHSFTKGSGIPPINSDGAYPYGGLILSSNTLYGTASVGGSSGFGTVFKVNTNGAGFTTLHTFTGGDGANPEAGLILSGNTLYGTAYYGGSSGNGAVFKVNADATGFMNLHSFTASSTNSSGVYTNSDGANPEAGLILSGNTLYGTALYGGSSGSGTMFALNTNGTAFTNLHSFTAAPSPLYTNSDGAYPFAGLILSGSTLYGTAVGGGSSGNGTVFSISLGSRGMCAEPVFARPSPFPFRASVGSVVAVGDFNGDGTPDLAVGGSGAGGQHVGIDINLGDGTGGFGAPNGFPTANSASAIVVGDFNGDGKLDIAAAIEAEDEVDILFGNGDGTFTAGVPVPVGDAPVAITAGDFNKDGKLDLAVLNGADGTLSILLGNGSGGFPTLPPISFTNGPFFSLGGRLMAGGDFNGDGVLDLAIVTSTGSFTDPSAVSLFLGLGDGRFFRAGSFAVGTSPASLVVADFNGDGWPDLAVANSGSSNISFFASIPGGGFMPQQIFQVGSGPADVTVGDFNGDGLLDLAVANSNDGTISIFSGGVQGTNSFVSQTLLFLGTGYTYPTSVATCDFNADGALDLVIVGGSGLVLLNACRSPELSIVASGGNVVLTWATNASGFSLQSTTNLVSPAVWTTVSPGPVVVNGQNTVTNPISGPYKFYRLIQ